MESEEIHEIPTETNLTAASVEADYSMSA